MLHLGKIQQFLQKAMQPPDEKAVANAIFSLKRMVGIVWFLLVFSDLH